MGTQIADKIAPFIGRVLYRHFLGPSFQWKRVDALDAEINPPDLKRESQFAALFVEINHGYSIGSEGTSYKRGKRD